MENEKEKDMTLDDLARIVQNGFLKIDERFTGIDTRLDGIDVRLDSMDERLDNINEQLQHVEDTTTQIKTNLNKKVDKFEYNTLEYRVERLEDARAA